MATWINFKELREKLRLRDVLAQYDVQLKIRGEKATCLCPLPTHPTRGDGKKRTPSFSANLAKGIWRCFGCGAQGNVLDLGAMMQGLDPDDPVQLRKAALKLAETFGIECQRPSTGRGANANVDEKSVIRAGPVAPACAPTPAPRTPPVASAARVLVNEPIDFELKQLDPKHPYLAGRGFTPETIDHFGLGFCSRGMMTYRVAIPIHDPPGRLVGYAGRLIDDDRINDEHPKYLFPGRRERDGVVHEFRKSMLVYNLHRLGGKVSDLIIVEGFASVWWLHQNGYPNVVALMGSSCSPEQAGLITQSLENDGRIWLMPDGNGGGEHLATQALPLLAAYRFTYWVKLGRSQQPTELNADDLARLLTLGAGKSASLTT